jgi:hypothetical protein
MTNEKGNEQDDNRFLIDRIPNMHSMNKSQVSLQD